jgi:hypothetical protein
MRGVQSRKEVIKHSAAVQIQNNITLLQRRAWNVLLANAYDELPTEEEHRIAIRDLVKVLEYGGHNDAYLKEALQTASQHCLRIWGMKPTVLDDCNLSDLHTWALMYS